MRPRLRRGSCLHRRERHQGPHDWVRHRAHRGQGHRWEHLDLHDLAPRRDRLGLDRQNVVDVRASCPDSVGEPRERPLRPDGVRPARRVCLAGRQELVGPCRKRHRRRRGCCQDAAQPDVPSPMIRQLRRGCCLVAVRSYGPRPIRSRHLRGPLGRMA